jgi:hypothetical protein
MVVFMGAKTFLPEASSLSYAEVQNASTHSPTRDTLMSYCLGTETTSSSTLYVKIGMKRSACRETGSRLEKHIFIFCL